ncbi:flavin reductase family protein [Streptomyces sp. NPDC048331]|uniref:flavin reductase family protein n=1 Tax=Streptomyces sp. NPDC048331 TaxID=3365534 RepID=UPI0037135537
MHSTVPRGHHLDGPSTPQAHRDLRSLMGELPAGVTVLTTMSPEGPVGMTTSAVTSLSMNPPMILACLTSTSATLARILSHRTFAVNILTDAMEDTSDRFANGPVLERFAAVPHHLVDGVPLLDGTAGAAICHVAATHPGGDHTILTATVTRTLHGDGSPLLRHRAAYRRIR